MDQVSRIKELKEKRNAVILVHNYCLPEVQDVADFIGDSLGLSIKAAETDAEVIVFCGVTFMAETAKILNPSKIVISPQPHAVCAMAQMCSPSQIVDYRKENPDAEVVGYVNSTAASKAEMDVCCTSSNSVDVVSKLSSGKVLFVPDQNLGRYTKSKCPDAGVVLWNGMCPIHHSITVGQVRALKEAHPDAVSLAHPECRAEVLDLVDHVCSTEGMLNICRGSDRDEFIIVTEVGMKHRLEKEMPGKRFYFPEYAVCSAMKMVDLDSIVSSLENLSNQVELDPQVIDRARVPVQRMIGREL